MVQPGAIAVTETGSRKFILSATQNRSDRFLKILAFSQKLGAETVQMIRFFSIIPVPKLPFETDPHAAPDFSKAVRMLPIAALLIALPGVAAIWIATSLWLSALLVALIAVAIMSLVTGGLHEDGLADFADGLGGGTTIERRLEIMRDSRIGSSGATALFLVMAAKVLALGSLIDHQGTFGAVSALIAAAALSRVMALLPLWLLPAARPDGRSATVGQPQTSFVLVAVMMALLISLALLQGIGNARLLLAVISTFCISLGICRLAKSKLGGHTGDVIGATQQLCEVTFLILLNAGIHA